MEKNEPVCVPIKMVGCYSNLLLRLVLKASGVSMFIKSSESSFHSATVRGINENLNVLIDVCGFIYE